MSNSSKPTKTSAEDSNADDDDVFHDARFPPEEEAELLKRSNAYKSDANKLFASACYQEAIFSYNQAISYCPNYLDYEIGVLRSNIAACQLRLKDWKAAVDAATASIDCFDRLFPALTQPDGTAAKGGQHGGESSAVIEITGDGDEADEEEQLKKLNENDSRREDVKRIRSKALMRRARGRMELEGWSNLQGAEEDYKEVLRSKMLPRSDELAVQKALRELPEKINIAKEKEVSEMMGKLKELGNGILKPFGLSTDSFKFVKDENTGGYNLNFEK